MKIERCKMDLFNEYIIERKKSYKEYIKIVGMILGTLVLIFAAISFSRYLQSFFLLLVAGIIYLLYIGVTSMSVEFEYSVTNGDVDIDKIVARRKRTRIVSVHSRTFEYFAPLISENMNVYNDQSITKRIDATSNTGNDKVYFAIYYKNQDKICLTFEPTEKMLDDFSRNVSKRAFFRR